MKYLLIGVQLLFVVLLCDAAETFWNKFVEKNGKQAYGFYCNVTDVEFYKQQPSNNTNFIRFMQMQPNVTYITQLKFQKCRIDFLRQQCKSVQNLNAIDISYSDYDRLSFANWSLTNLKVINASHNRLHEIASTLFGQSSKINEIDFSYNNIQRIEATTFANATQLQWIYLSNNNLTAIDDAAFVNLIHLQWIDLSKNRIRTLEPLQTNRRLQTIRATENPIFSFNCDHFTKMDTISVFISWNLVKKLDLMCKKATQFRIISNGTNEMVILHQNMITSQSSVSEIHCTAGSMTNIESCSIAGRNRFKNITQLLQCFGAKIKRITVSGNFFDNQTAASLASATSTAFQRFVELEWLNLKDTALIEFDFHALQHQRKLMRLDLSQNHLKQLKSVSLLAEFDSLSEFKMAENQLENTQEIIANLKGSIKWLDLSDNFVGIVNASTFQRFENLTTLKLSNTNLTITGNHNPFGAIKNLSIFDVSRNNLSSLDFGILASTMSRLKRFYAANCQLTNATNIIRYFSEQHLLELDLSGNDFAAEIFTVDTFKRLTKLQYLHLNDANLQTFHFDWLQFNHELRAVKLSNNKLHSIEMTTDMVMVNLKRLDLDGNDLNELNKIKRSMLPALDYLAVSKNQFECENLIRLQQIFSGIKFIGEPLQHQKHGENCCLIRNIHAEMGERTKYAVGILIAIVIVSFAMILVTCYFYLRKPKLNRNEQMLKKIRQSMRDSEYFAPTFQIPDDDDDGMDEYRGENNDIYDTISLEKHNYDHLQFDTDPMPFNDDVNQNYLHIGLINDQIPLRNLTSRL